MGEDKDIFIDYKHGIHGAGNVLGSRGELFFICAYEVMDRKKNYLKLAFLRRTVHSDELWFRVYDDLDLDTYISIINSPIHSFLEDVYREITIKRYKNVNMACISLLEKSFYINKDEEWLGVFVRKGFLTKKVYYDLVDKYEWTK